MMLRMAPLALAAALLGGCMTPQPASDGLTRLRLGQTGTVGGPRVTPLAVLEDSRCPANVNCVWAGRVRLSVRIDLGSGSTVRELTSDQPLPVADGTLELVTVEPAKPAQGTIAARDYRFGLRFAGGL